jgi:ABC transport system ATP-binding/permease protein
MAPANLVNLEDVAKTYGTRALLDGVSLGVADGERIGVVGRNGGGKTTLVSILAGAVPPDRGRVTHTGGLQVGLLAQADVLNPGATVRDVVLGSVAEHVWASDARTRGLIDALLAGISLDALVGPLSGGERRRVALGALLVADPDLLVLDEPPNHLDVEGVDWLARHLASRRGALVVVTHDRWFLDEVCTRTWEVADGQVRAYDGGYAAYVLARAERERVAAADEARRQNLLRKELAWLRRGPPARTSKPQFRIDAANALIENEPPPRDSVEIMRFASARLGKTVYDVEDVTMVLGGRTLLDSVTWRLGPGDRVGVVGVNGAGKSTLLRLLAGDLEPTAGHVKRGKTVRAAYLAQEVVELEPTQRVLEAVEEIATSVDLGRGRSITAAQLVERLGFARDRAWARVGDLSGGERRRLQLVRLLMTEPNVLLLDEPTNDLDIETLTSVEDLLDGFAGTVVVVSHDRYALERVCDRVVGLLGDGRVRDLPGGVEEYLTLRRAALGALSSASSSGPVSSGRPSAGDRRVARKELTRIERRMERLTAEEALLHEELTAHASDFERVQALDRRLREVLAERADLEDTWLALAEEAEGA